MQEALSDFDSTVSIGGRSLGLPASRSHLACFALTKIFEKKKCVSIDSKCSETHRNAKKKFYPFDRLRASRVAQ